MECEIKEIIYLPTLRCNLTCQHCIVKHFYKETEEMTCKEVLAKIKESKLISKCHVSICGGEVFLKRDLEDLILGLVNDEEREWFVDITTNGYFCDRIRSVAEKVEHPERLRFSISIDGIEETHNKIRGNKNAYANVIKSLEIVSSFGIHAEVNTVMQPDNFNELSAMKEKFSSMGDMVSYTPIPMVIFSNREDTFAFKDGEIRNIYPYIRSNVDMKGIASKGRFRLKDCHASTNNIVIDPVGKVYPCAYRGQLMMDSEDRDLALIGNLREQSIDEIFLGERKKKVYDEIVRKCPGCNHNCDLYREAEFFGLKYNISEKEAKYMLENVDTIDSFYDFNWEPIEYDDGVPFRWMNTSSAKIYFRNTGNLLKICYKSMCEGMLVRICVNDEEITFTSKAGMNEEAVELKRSSRDILTCAIEVSDTWVPAEHVGGHDYRTLGIALYSFEICKKEGKATVNNIDVAKIMADITCDVEKRYSEVAIKEREEQQFAYEDLNEVREALTQVSEDITNINGELCYGIKGRNHLLVQEINKIHSLGGIPWKIPTFEWKNKLIRGPVKFVAKIISKLARFITVQQNDVNDTVTKSLELLQESTLSMADWSRTVEERLAALTDTVNHAVDELNYQSAKTNYISRKLHDLTEIDMTDKMYRDFEKSFRGSVEEIEKRQKYYIDNYVLNNVSAEAVGMVVDLGCGRGEWLKLLKENGYNGLGVDLNEEFLKTCEANEIKTAHMDVLAYLKTLPSESVKLLTSFQLIEHLNTNQIIELFREMGRVLREDGMIILETPNPVNVNVGAGSFYVDPTHKRQVHPELLKFFARENQFEDIEIAYWQQEDIDKWWNSVWKRDETTVMDSHVAKAMEDILKQSLWCSADYALIARK